LIQLRILEEKSLAGIQIISNNTDGTTCIVPIDKIDDYHRISCEIAEEFGIGWEFTNIKKIVYTNVNNYIAFPSSTYMLDNRGTNIQIIGLKEDTKPKRKGLYKYGKDIPLGDSVNEQVVAKALELFWKDGISVSESISNPEKYGFHIYDYCKSNRIDKTYEVFYEGKKVQNLNRYYFQKKGAYLLKRKKEPKNGKKSNFEHVNVGEGVCLFNNYEEKSFAEYDINYSHYIEKACTLITEILNRQLTLF
jgi:hypothetical protein